MRALVVPAEGESRPVGSAELDELTARAAAGLARRGVGEGAVVLVRLAKSLEWLVAMRALWRLGAIAVVCPNQLTNRDVENRMRRSSAAIALLQPADVPNGPAQPPPPAAAPGPSAPAFLLYTSGTEGEPKGALHARSYVAANRLQTERWMGVRADDRIWCTAAAGWSKSLRNVWLAAELTGAETVIHEGRFDAAERLRLLAELRPQVLCMSPTEYRMCAAAEEFGGRTLPGLREAVAAGEALDAATVASWREAYGVTIRDGYGQTETGALAGVPAGGSAPAGAIGRALPGIDLEVRRGGELWARTASVPTFFRGYWEDVEATGARLHDGWWQTGDLVREEEGVLWFAGRADDVISSSGYRIGPGEVEAALRSHPAVRECAVVGIADAERGQIVHADVIAVPGTVVGDDLAEELRHHVRSVTAPYKYPRSIRFVHSLPWTATGKIRRSAVRDDLAGRHEGVTKASDETWGPGP